MVITVAQMMEQIISVPDVGLNYLTFGASSDTIPARQRLFIVMKLGYM